jgi:subtilase family serine protease
MVRRIGFAAFSFTVLMLVFTPHLAFAQGAGSSRRSRPVITQNIDETKLQRLPGNTRREANRQNDRGPVADNFPMDHILLLLRRSPEQEKALQQFIDDLHNPASLNFHMWLTATEFGERFGLAQQDLDTIKFWLQRHGFVVNHVYPNQMFIDFSGTAGQVGRAFRTDIHSLDVRSERHVANMSDPQIPAALVPAVHGVVSLHDFRPRTMHKMRNARPKFTFGSLFGDTFAMVPADLATIYNLNPLFSAGYSGQAQTIVLIEDTDVFSTSDWNIFRSAFGLSAYTSGSFSTVHPAPSSGPNNCASPGAFAPNDAEAILDAEWASAAAPSAALVMASCADTNTTFGGLIALQNLLNSNSQPPAIVSISYGQCETVNGAAANAAYNATYQQGVAEGVSIFVAAGDSGGAACDNSVTEATHGIGANAFASTPYNVAVGGTDFSDTFSGTNSTYWSPTNSSTFMSALSYIPEIPWNDSCAGVLLSNYVGFSPTYGSSSLCNDPSFGQFFQTTVAGGAGPSGCATGTPSISDVVSGACQGWSKPSWQSVLGNPNDGVRDTPDISLFAADGLWSHYYIFCWSDTAGGGTTCGSDPGAWSGAGGTSFAAPIMAGIQALINQKTGARQGNPNPVLYQLAAGEYGAGGNSSCNSSNVNGASPTCIFYDVTQGDLDVNCTGNFNCYLPSGTQGVLSTSDTSYSPAYGASIGWDFATGIGTLNAANLVNNWPSTAPGYALSASPGSFSLTQGSTGTSTITITPQNGFTGNVSLSASGLPNGVTASFSPNPAISTSNLTLTATSAAATGAVNVLVTGTSGSLTSTATLTLSVVTAGNFNLSASPGSLSLTRGSSGTSTITITPQNGFTGNVNLSASGLPNGVTASFSPNPATSTSSLTLTANSTATTGTVSVTLTGTSGSLTNSTTLSLTVGVAPNPTFPSGWLDQDVGAVGVAGSASYTNGSFTVKASGQWIWNTADSMHFVYQSLSGDGTIVARAISLAGGSSSQSTGVMIRETLDTSAKHAYTAFGQSQVFFTERTTAGGSTSAQSLTGTVALPYWVKLTRSGSTFTSYASLDGVNWVQIGTPQSISMAQAVYIGLAVSSDQNSTLTTATFDNVSLSTPAVPAPILTNLSPTSGSIGTQVLVSGLGFGTSQGNSMVRLNGALVTVNTWSNTSLSITISSGATSGPLAVSVAPSMNNSNPLTFTVTTLPTPWLDQDVGAVGVAGSASYTNGSFTVKASGQWIWNTADSMHFVYQSLSGDGTIVARAISLAGGSSSQSTGVMIRETLDTSAKHAYTAFGQSQVFFTERTTAGGSTSAQSLTGTVALPYWVKLTRSGSTFTSYASQDGVNWVQIGTPQSISMVQAVYIGLAVSSDQNSTLTTATFDNVAISIP